MTIERVHRDLLCVIVGACLSTFGPIGCVPARFVEIPALRGRVIGPDSQPVGGAVVRVIRDRDDAEVAAISSRPDGSFDRPEQSHMTVQFAGADGVLTTYSVTATSGILRSPTTQVGNGTRRWFFGYYDPPLDRDLGTLQVR